MSGLALPAQIFSQWSRATFGVSISAEFRDRYGRRRRCWSFMISLVVSGYKAKLPVAPSGEVFLMSFPRFSALPVERRANPREPKHHIVRLRFDDDLPWHRGILNNLSVGGACVSISISNAIAIPAEFTLILPPNTSRRCRLVWQSGQKLGVEFLNA